MFRIGSSTQQMLNEYLWVVQCKHMCQMSFLTISMRSPISLQILESVRDGNLTSQAIAIVSISVLLHQTVGSLFFSCLLPAPWASSSLCPSLWPMVAAILLPTATQDCWILWYRWTRGLDMLTAPLTPRKSMTQPWLSGSLLCSCLQPRLLSLVTAVWLHSPCVGQGPVGRMGYRSSWRS